MELPTKIPCLICGKMLGVLNKHVKFVHGISGDEYKAKYGGEVVAPAVLAKRTRSCKRFWNTPEGKDKARDRCALNTPENIAARSHIIAAANRNPAHKKARAEGFKRWVYETEDGRKFRDSQAKSMKGKAERIWKDDSFREKMREVGRRNFQRVSAHNVDPNGLELRFYEIALQAGIDVTYTDHKFWKRLKDGRSITPDFMVDGLVIEIYGDYWHRGDDPQDRINDWDSVGLTAIVIWEHEMKEPEQVLQRLAGFLEDVA